MSFRLDPVEKRPAVHAPASASLWSYQCPRPFGVRLRSHPAAVTLAAVAWLALAASPSRLCSADESNAGDADPPHGHSIHGEAFSEGPRQAADLIEGCGDVQLQVTTSVEQAQALFNQGVGQLHGFWFFEAERSFRQVLKLDPECLMAYWGIAMANMENVERGHRALEALDREELQSAWERLPARERQLIESIRRCYSRLVEAKDHRQAAPWRDLVRAWEQWLVDHPDDIEIKAFLVGLIWRNESRHNLPISSHLSVAALADEVLAVNPTHPVHHYLIHLWDNEKAERALPSAAWCGPSAPGIAHMWHMPSHIYSKLQRYADAAWHQEASSRVDHAHMIRYSIMPEEIFNYVHNQGWLVDSLSHVGRADESMSLARNLIELPRIPRSGGVNDTPDQRWTENRSGYRAGRSRLQRLLWTWEAWDQVMEWSDTPWLDDNGDDDWRDERRWLIATAAFHLGQAEFAESELASIQRRIRRTSRRADEAESGAREQNEDKDQAAIDKAVADARRPFDNRLKNLRRQAGELEVLAAFKAGDHETAAERLATVEDLPDLRQVRWLIDLNQAEPALEKARDLVRRSRGQVAPLVELARAAALADDQDELGRAMDQLRPLAAAADLHHQPLQRLAAVAAEMSLPTDWRTQEPPPGDIGPRPDLAGLGPLRWHPPLAPGWQLPDRQGEPRSSESFTGQPYLLIFFLGRECTHCMEQLNAFAPVTADFADAGLPIVAVSTDSVEGLQRTFRDAAGEEDAPPTDAGAWFPFPLVSDGHGEAFRRFRAWDDFENTPLHGTFLIDATGRIRWQHISYEPFMEVDFLLEEARRLLQFPAPPLPAAPYTQARQP